MKETTSDEHLRIGVIATDPLRVTWTADDLLRGER